MRRIKLEIMKYLSVSSVLLLLVMFVTSCVEEKAPTSATVDSSNDNLMAFSKGGVVHHVSVGGADVCEAFGLPPGCDANFSLEANMYDDGSVLGQWQDTFSGGGAGIHVAVDCINIVGNGAVIGGVITHGTRVNGEDVTGLRALTAVVNNGTSANDPPDQISLSFIDLPFDCDDVTPADFAALGFLFDITNGQVKVW